MLKYLNDTYGERATHGDKSMLDFSRDEVKRLEQLLVLLYPFSTYDRKIRKKRRRNRKKKKLKKGLEVRINLKKKM